MLRRYAFTELFWEDRLIWSLYGDAFTHTITFIVHFLSKLHDASTCSLHFKR